MAVIILLEGEKGSKSIDPKCGNTGGPGGRRYIMLCIDEFDISPDPNQNHPHLHSNVPPVVVDWHLHSHTLVFKLLMQLLLEPVQLQMSNHGRCQDLYGECILLIMFDCYIPHTRSLVCCE